jgi:REP element-mobilizing transposase RayT
MNSPRLRIGRVAMIHHAYELTIVCDQRRRWFDDIATARIVAELFPLMDQQKLTASISWVVMPDHVHWLFQLGERPLSYVAQRFKSRSALLLNRLHQRQGRVWQTGYHDHCLRTDASLRRHAFYVMENPVRAGLASRVGEYPHAWCRWPLDEDSR